MTLTRDIVADTVEKYGDAWAGQDSNALLEIFTEDAMYIERPNRTHEGHGEIKEMWENMIVGKQSEVCFKHIIEDMIFDEATMSAVVKWEASFHALFPDGTQKREHPFRAVWSVTLRFRECDDGNYRVCWYEEFWHPIKTEQEKGAKKGKGKGKAKGAKNVGGVVLKPKATTPAARLAAATARAANAKVKKPMGLFVKKR